jgi:hypothetical protein
MENEVPVHSNIPNSLHKFRQPFLGFCIMVQWVMNTFKLIPLLQIVGHLWPVWFVTNYATLCLRLVVQIE